MEISSPNEHKEETTNDRKDEDNNRKSNQQASAYYKNDHRSWDIDKSGWFLLVGLWS